MAKKRGNIRYAIAFGGELSGMFLYDDDWGFGSSTSPLGFCFRRRKDAETFCANYTEIVGDYPVSVFRFDTADY